MEPSEICDDPVIENHSAKGEMLKLMNDIRRMFICFSTFDLYLSVRFHRRPNSGESDETINKAKLW